MNRRDMMKRVAVGLFGLATGRGHLGGSTVSHTESVPTLMPGELAGRLFKLAEDAEEDKGTPIMGAGFQEGAEVQLPASVKVRPAKPLRDHFLFDSGGNVERGLDDIMKELGKHLAFTQDRGAWNYQSEKEMSLYSSLEGFAGDKDFRKCPLVIWKKSCHIPRRHDPPRGAVKVFDQQVHAEVDLGTAATFPLGFGLEERTPKAVFDLESLVFDDPDHDYKAVLGKEADDWIQRERGGRLANGRRLPPVFEQSLGVVGECSRYFPEGYSPVYEPFTTRDAEGRVVLILMRTLIVARLVRVGPQVWVHELFITLNPERGSILYINAIYRTFSEFMENGPELRAFLVERVGVKR
jgi:hypothetical protein